MLDTELNLRRHKKWRKQVVDAFVGCRDVDMGEHVEIPLADWERLQKALMQSTSQTLSSLETFEQIAKERK